MGPEELVGNAESQRSRALLTLREIILRGEFKAGDHIPEIPLAARIGVSRTPVRLALEQLAQEGLLEPRNTGGFQAREFTIQDIWDAIEVRGALEGTAARLASERLSDSRELDPVLRIAGLMDELIGPSLAKAEPLSTQEMSRFGELNGVFHAGLVELAKSPMVKWSLERIQSIPFAAPNRVIPSRSVEGTIVAQAQHRALLDAIGHREGARAEHLAREHARFARHSLERALSQPRETGGTEDLGVALIRGVAQFPNRRA